MSTRVIDQPEASDPLFISTHPTERSKFSFDLEDEATKFIARDYELAGSSFGEGPSSFIIGDETTELPQPCIRRKRQRECPDRLREDLLAQGVEQFDLAGDLVPLRPDHCDADFALPEHVQSWFWR